MHMTEAIPQTIPVLINGEQRDVPSGQSIDMLLTWLKVSGDRVAVELNKEIVRKRDWSRARVAGGSQIEIVEFVGGG